MSKYEPFNPGPTFEGDLDAAMREATVGAFWALTMTPARAQKMADEVGGACGKLFVVGELNDGRTALWCSNISTLAMEAGSGPDATNAPTSSRMDGNSQEALRKKARPKGGRGAGGVDGKRAGSSSRRTSSRPGRRSG